MAAPSARRAFAAAARAVGVWTVLVALFAMHGLPMQMPGAMPMSTSAASSTAAPAAPPMHAHGEALAAVTPTDRLDAATPSAAPDPSLVCESSDRCTATLRAAHADAAPEIVDIASRTGDRSDATHKPVAPIQTARPPDLDTLQISRA